eukprot:m.201552 g.201552  ORF g.201552 m.201552 type:complete len:281 (+) comp25231_c0_seq2:57-899(+)
MLGTQQATQSANPVTESDQIVGQSKIDGLNREINGLKADVDAKGKEIIQLEKEIGIKRQTALETVAERLEPVRASVVGAAGKVAQKAHLLSEKIQSRPPSNEPGSTPPAGDATGGEQAAQPPASPTADVAANPTTAATEVPEVAPANVARNKLRIATLQEEVSTINDTIKSKESDVAWLYKKHGLVRPGSFAAFKVTAATKLEVAKGRTKEGASHAKDNAIKMWATASTSIASRSKSVGSAASQKWAELRAKTKSNGKASPAAAKPAGGGTSDDMTSRYS